MPKPIILIAACDEKRGIGYKNALPWVLPDELIRFKQWTTCTSSPEKRNIVIMGRNTWESLPRRPLQKRFNMVLTQHPQVIEQEFMNMDPNEASYCGSLVEAIEYANRDPSIEQIYIIGGAKLYSDVLKKNLCDKILLTRVHGIHDVDTYLDEIPETHYEECYINMCDGNDFFVYKRRSP